MPGRKGLSEMIVISISIAALVNLLSSILSIKVS
jgi:hypothetical protein